MAKPTTKSPAVEGDEARPELPPPATAAPPQPAPQPPVAARLSGGELDAPERAEHAEAKDDTEREAAPSPPAPATPPIPPGPSATSRYVVWPHGALQRNGVTHEPGSTLELTSEQAAAIGECVQLCAPSEA